MDFGYISDAFGTYFYDLERFLGLLGHSCFKKPSYFQKPDWLNLYNFLLAGVVGHRCIRSISKPGHVLNFKMPQCEGVRHKKVIVIYDEYYVYIFGDSLLIL